MAEKIFLERMRADWNKRAGEDAHYYVAFGRRGQDEAEFFSTAADVVRGLEREIRRLPVHRAGEPRRALEIGCGPGRLIYFLHRHFDEIHGVDVSDEMVRLGRQKLAAVPNAKLHVGSGATLEMFPDGHFDFIYSYAVFQHIPSRDVVMSYLHEARRVLKEGGWMCCHINGLPPAEKAYDTWEGVRISAGEVVQFARDNSLQLVALEGKLTQYMWATMRKHAPGWQPRPAPSPANIVRITNARSSEPLVPARGRFACVSLWMENLPAGLSLDGFEARIGGLAGEPYYIGPPEVDGLQQVNINLAPGIATGMAPIELFWLGQPLAQPAVVRVVPAGPSVPRLASVADGTDLLAGTRIGSGTVKIFFEELAEPRRVRVNVGSVPVEDLYYFCTDPSAQKYEFNFSVPGALPAGAHDVVVEIGARRLAPVPIEIV